MARGDLVQLAALVAVAGVWGWYIGSAPGIRASRPPASVSGAAALVATFPDAQSHRAAHAEQTEALSAKAEEQEARVTARKQKADLLTDVALAVDLDVGAVFAKFLKEGKGGDDDTVRAAATAAESPANAKVVIATVETRLCSPPEKKPRWKNNYLKQVKMRNSGAAINLHYAQKHGYEYIVFCNGDARGATDAWLKVAALEWLVERAAREAVPTYLLLVDSDSVIRAMETRLEDWLPANNMSFPTLQWSLLFASETQVGSFDPAKEGSEHPEVPRNLLNTGVAYGYVDPHDRDRLAALRRVLELWQQASCDAALCLGFSRPEQHPWEQGCLQKLLFNTTKSIFQPVVHVSQQHMNLWNGPWGVFVRHVWGGPGKDKRNWVFDDMIESYRIDVSASLAAIKATMVAPHISVRRPCNMSGS